MLNLAMGAFQLFRGEVIEEGVLTFRCMNLVVGLVTLVISIVYVVNFFLGQGEREE